MQQGRLATGLSKRPIPAAAKTAGRAVPSPPRPAASTATPAGAGRGVNAPHASAAAIPPSPEQQRKQQQQQQQKGGGGGDSKGQGGHASDDASVNAEGKGVLIKSNSHSPTGVADEGGPWSRFERLETIGAGASGTAYLVRDRCGPANAGNDNEDSAAVCATMATAKGERLVIKRVFLRQSVGGSGGANGGPAAAEALKAAATEVQVLQMVPPHPNLVAYRGHFFDDEGYINIGTEYCPGGDLEMLIRQRCGGGGNRGGGGSGGAAANPPSNADHQPPSASASASAAIGGNAHHRPFSLEEVLFIAFQLLAGVAHLHRCGVIHRDLKPANILICASDSNVSRPREGAVIVAADNHDDDTDDLDERVVEASNSGGAATAGRRRLTHRDRVAAFQTHSAAASVTGMTLKIADFGIARVLETTHAEAQTVIGTPHYISPQLCNGEPYSLGADVWALGCIIYELASGNGQRCFGGDNMLAIVRRVCSGEVPRLPSPSMDMLLRPLLLAMLCPEEAMRLTAAQCLHEFFYTKDADFAEDFEDPEDDL